MSDKKSYGFGDVVKILDYDEILDAKSYPEKMQDLFGRYVTIIDIKDVYGADEYSYVIAEDYGDYLWSKDIFEKRVGHAVTKVDSEGVYILKIIENNKKQTYEFFPEKSNGELTKKEKKEFNTELLLPKEIKNHLDKYVVGQEEAKKAISIAVYNHYKRLKLNENIEDEIEIQKSNIMLIGKSGSGKTLIASKVAKILDVPFATMNATEYSPTGIVGKNVNDIIEELASLTEDYKEVERAIVFIDEIDKLAGGQFEGNAIKGSFHNETQSTFLKLLEGDIIEYYPSTDPFYSGAPTYIDTSNILFICAGAFTGIEKIMEKKQNKRAIGFNTPNINYEIKKNNKNKIGAEELINYGLMPELVGRIPVVVSLQNLSKDDLKKILIEPKDSIIKQYKKMFKEENIELTFTDDALEEIVNRVTSTKTGARGLRTVVEEILTPIMFEHSGNIENKKCIIKKENIENYTVPNLMEVNDGNKTS